MWSHKVPFQIRLLPQQVEIEMIRFQDYFKKQHVTIALLNTLNNMASIQTIMSIFAVLKIIFCHRPGAQATSPASCKQAFIPSIKIKSLGFHFQLILKNGWSYFQNYIYIADITSNNRINDFK